MAENIRLAIISLAVGFSIEAAAGILQITSYGSAYRRWIGLYYVGLVTTGLGLFLLYRGWYRWTELHPGNALRRGWFLRAVLALGKDRVWKSPLERSTVAKGREAPGAPAGTLAHE